MRLILLLGVCFAISISEAAEVRVASAANFYPVLNKIVKKFEAETAHKVVIIRGSSGKLYAQIMNGAPYDVFLSADSERADKLVENGNSYNGKTTVYANGLMALWLPEAKNTQQIKDQLLKGELRKIAIANPKTAPYGKAAVETMKAMKIYSRLKHKLVFGENISQTLQFVQAGAADIGFVARSHVINDIYWKVDENLHGAIKQKMVLLKQSKQIEAASEFMAYMQSPDIKKMINENGYKL